MGYNSINGLLLRKLMIAGANELNNNKQLVDSLNVFPVPDGDTGTNMSLTMLSAAREVEKSASIKTGDIAKLAANGSLRGARGNSGVILSQLIRGFSKAVADDEEVNTKKLAQAAKRGVETAYKAVMKPKEGTILTVARAIADSAAIVCEETDDIETFLKRVIEDGKKMLERTPDMLPVLKAAGVVDAGGMGLICILEGALNNLYFEGEIKVDEPSSATVVDFSALASVEQEEITFGYCTEFFILVQGAEDSVVNKFRTYLSTIGDCVLVINDDEVIKVHVHTDHPGLAIEKALEIGALNGLKIDNMRIQHTNKIDFKGENAAAATPVKEEAPAAPAERKKLGFVSICAGDGFADIFKNLGVDEVIEGGQTMNPSTEDILNAVKKVNADNVIVFPNNKNIILAANQAAIIEEDKKVFVVETTAVPEGITAMINYNPDEEIEDIIEEMNEAKGMVKTCTTTFAVRDTVIDDKEITEGDILGMYNGAIAVIAKDKQEGTKELVKQAIDEDSEIISIYYGSDVTEEDAEEIGEFIEEEFPDCEVEIVRGGQPLYYYVISVE